MPGIQFAFWEVLGKTILFHITLELLFDHQCRDGQLPKEDFCKIVEIGTNFVILG